MKTNKDFEDGQWNWMMQYCKENRLPPAHYKVWNKAKEAYNQRNVTAKGKGSKDGS